jgi:hypothetical protein
MFKRGLVALFALLVSVAVVVPSGSASADVSQTPGATGCPAGFERLSVDWLLTQGPYLELAAADAAGNDNGFVCGQSWSNAAYAAHCRAGCPVPVLYTFGDDDSPALKN